MATVTGPLLSLDARGQIAKTLVTSSWKGRTYTRQYVIPANPQSAEQTKTRNSFSWLNGVWKTAPADFVAPWAAFAAGKVLTDRNAFISKNNGLLRSATGLVGMVMSPGAKGGLATIATKTPAAGQVTVGLATPSPLPAGWTIVKGVAVAILEQNPQSGTDYTVESGSDATDPYSIVLTGLAAGDWAVAGWLVYQKSALATDLAYGPAIATIETVT